MPGHENYCVYEDATGEITSWGTCAAGASAVVSRPDGSSVYSALIEDGGPWTTWSHYFSAGAPVPYNESQAEAKRARPRWRGKWSNTTMAWFDPNDLATAKALKFRELLEDWRRADDQSTFTHGALLFLSDPWSVRRIMTMDAAVRANAGALPAWFPASYKAESSEFLTIDSAATWNSFVLSMGQSFAERYEHAMSLRTLVLALGTVEAVNAVTWETGL